MQVSASNSGSRKFSVPQSALRAPRIPFDGRFSGLFAVCIGEPQNADRLAYLLHANAGGGVQCCLCISTRIATLIFPNFRDGYPTFWVTCKPTASAMPCVFRSICRIFHAFYPSRKDMRIFTLR